EAIVLAYARDRRLCLASLFSGVKKRIAMWSGLWGRLTLHQCLSSHIISNPRPVSEILLACSRALGAPDRGLKPDFFLTDEECAAAEKLAPVTCRERSWIGIHPGTAGNTCNLPSRV